MGAVLDFFDYPKDLEPFLNLIKSKLCSIIEAEIGEVRINFVFIDSEIMTTMNEEYRHKKGPTDVLTFVYAASESGDEFESIEEAEIESVEGPYAEGYICLDVVKSNAEEFGNTFEKELITVFVHSILHMAGYDHEYDSTNAEEMFRKQEEYLKEFQKIIN
ncbi:MAG: rRNA maturation RNase YbeY [Fervidobacterium sp.]|uniref:Endoribonuclease YbeY n=1 Tax=Fervidobacterium gondwanense DSM 13020 TaxID=1121883 RepID=A0A1M7SIE5_FERGO|nr:rRNA maturation RNase YbeY [Fervidobacterium gondwanense]SHN58223.1 probable rRNA maturation factor [Fervidobacterium gondwanense DSM 13020]